MALRLVDYMRQDAVYETMKKLNIKIFGSFERCKDRLERFLAASAEKERQTQYEGPKTVHVETIPVIDDTDKKIIHVAVNTDDVLDVANTLIDMKMSDSDMELLVEKYKRFLVDAVLLPEMYADYKLRSQMESYIEWKTAHKDFIKNGFVSSLTNE